MSYSLTTREAAFVEALLGAASGNQSRAAELAGYAPGKGLSVTAARLVRRPHVAAAIAERRAALLAAEPAPVLTGPEDPAVAAEKAARWQAQAAGVLERRAILSRWARHDRHVISAIRAIDTLNRMDGVYVEKHEHAVMVPKPVIHEHVGLIEAPMAPSVTHKRG
jgi:hypothetical protein